MTNQPRPTILEQALIIEKLAAYDESDAHGYAKQFREATTYDELVTALVEAAGISIPNAKAALVFCAQRTSLSQELFDDALNAYLIELNRVE